MRLHISDVRFLWAVVVAGMMAASLSVVASAGAASRPACSGPGAQPPNAGSRDFLTGVAATSVCNAWGVGYYFTTGGSTSPTHTLVEHWNGRTWRIQASPNPGGNSRLFGVAATSASNAWAVGGRILHWNGRVWKVQPSPNVFGVLNGVAATSRSNVWAVGSRSSAALIEHWNGRAWKVQASPCPPGADECQLNAVAATSATNAWAVGSEIQHGPAGGVPLMLIEHWNGHAWTVQTSPNPTEDDGGALTGVAATSASNAWAVGAYQRHGVGGVTFIERWNGQAWKIQSSPNPGGATGSELSGVTATSGTNAWAVGDTNFTAGAARTLIVHWNGTAWKVQATPNPGSRSNSLNGVSALSASNAWAVGSFQNRGRAPRTLAMRFNPTRWRARRAPAGGFTG